MIELDRSTGVFAVFMLAVIVSSGCIQGGSTDLRSDFDTSHEEVDLNRSGMEVYEDAFSGNFSDYSVEADNRMAMNLPVVGVTVNMSSDGNFQDDGFEADSSGVMGISLGDNSNSTEFSSRVYSTDNGTKVFKAADNVENETSTEDYSRGDLGLSLEAIEEIDVESASVLGVANLSGEENLILELDVNASSLMRNSEDIFEVHSLIGKSTDGEGMDEVSSFNETEAYLWADRENLAPSKFAYYGSAGEGMIQARSVTEFR